MTEQQMKRLNGYTIHLAEDEFLNQRMISAFLEECGASVTLSENGRELLGAVQKNRGDCILMDLQMPVMNGLDATRTIRGLEQKNDKSVPIIALTAQDAVDFEEKCLLAGMDAYATKPVIMDQLIDVILRLNKTGTVKADKDITAC